jgi:hypothetical protein
MTAGQSPPDALGARNFGLTDGAAIEAFHANGKEYRD